MRALPRSPQARAAVLAAGIAVAMAAAPPPSHGLSGFDNGEWVVAGASGAGIPERPFQVRIDGRSAGRTRLLTFASRIRGGRVPQVLVIASSGYLRIKPGADPTPPLPFGQSLVLGPAVYGSSSSFAGSTLFFNPQVQRVGIDTGRLRRDGTGRLRIRVLARDSGLAATSTNTNQIMDLAWRIELFEPTPVRTRVGVHGTFSFTEAVTPDPERTAQFQSFRLFQLSSMFIDDSRHDVDGLRYRGVDGPVAVTYAPAQAGMLLPASPSPLAPGRPVLDSIHSDDVGLPNGDTPSYRIRVRSTGGPVSGPLTPRAFFASSDDLNDDNLGLWIHQEPEAAIPAGTRGEIEFSVVATAGPAASAG